jgi:secondary thiamine-phosphate synthase enzyme
VETLSIQTNRHKEIVDITEEISNRISIGTGLVNVFIAHTTAAITTADLDPGTDLDFLDAIEAISPNLKYRHPHNPEHADVHIMSSIIGPEVTVPVENCKLVLGTWQRVVLVELEGPRKRNLQITQISID